MVGVCGLARKEERPRRNLQARVRAQPVVQHHDAKRVEQLPLVFMDTLDLAIANKYAGYIDRQQVEIARQLAQEDARLPSDLDYGCVRGLSIEVKQKLAAVRPETLGQAARISGVTPAAISLLLVHLKRSVAARETAEARSA
jgi:tRNA uridine 5-carboxymethylaminomethyl modification enzyme